MKTCIALSNANMMDQMTMREPAHFVYVSMDDGVSTASTPVCLRISYRLVICDYIIEKYYNGVILVQRTEEITYLILARVSLVVYVNQILDGVIDGEPTCYGLTRNI